MSSHTGSWMQGFPPKRQDVVRFSDGTFYQWPQFKWAVCNIQQLVPTKSVWRGDAKAHTLTKSSWQPPVGDIVSQQGEHKTWEQVLSHTETDGLLIMHKGQVIHESYHGHQQQDQSHLIMSAAKSMVGLLAQMLIVQGELNPQALISHYLPELSDTAFADATVAQVLDMEIGMVFEENYLDPDSQVWRYLRAGGMLPQADGKWECLSDYLLTINKLGDHGQAFAYREPNINVASWLIRRVTDKHLNQLLSEKVWQHIGASHDGLYMVDPSGAETTMALTLRSFVQFGEWVRTHGNGSLQPEVLNTLVAGGSPSKFAKAQMTSMEGWSYKSLWWVRHMEHGNAICARGAHGQLLYIDPAKELTVAWYSSTKEAPGHFHDHWRFSLIDRVAETVTVCP